MARQSAGGLIEDRCRNPRYQAGNHALNNAGELAPIVIDTCDLIRLPLDIAADDRLARLMRFAAGTDADNLYISHRLRAI